MKRHPRTVCGVAALFALLLVSHSPAHAECKVSHGEVEKRPSIIIENEKVTVEIIPEWGGKIWSYIVKRTGTNCLDVRGRTGGFSDETFIFSNHYWEPVPYKGEILKNTPDEVSVQVTGQRQIPHYEVEIKLVRTMTLKKGSSCLEIVTEMHNLGPADYDPAELPSPSFPGAVFLYALHPETGIGKDGSKNDLLYIPRKEGIVVTSAENPDRALADGPGIDAAVKPMFRPARGWIGVSDTQSNDFFFLTFDPKSVIGCQLYLGWGFYNLELVYTPVKLPAGSSHKFPFAFTSDVTEVKDMPETLAFRNFAAPEFITPGQPMKSCFEIVSLKAEGEKARLSEVTTGADGQVIAKLEEEMAVPSQKFLMVDRELASGPAGSYGVRKHVFAVNGVERAARPVRAIDETSRAVLDAHAQAVEKVRKLETEAEGLKNRNDEAVLHLKSLQAERALLFKMLQTPGYTPFDMPRDEPPK